MKQFETAKADFARYRVVDAPALHAGDGEVIARVERFAFTANNITYAAIGDQIGYWRFFPPLGADASDWGVIPVWGFATIEQSRCEGLSVGERLFGYFPPATHVRLQPSSITSARLIDATAHRSQLPAAYNLYRRVAAAGSSDARADDERALLWPLHVTSYGLWDALSEARYHGAQQVLIVSASAKTSIGLAYALQADTAAPRIIGITSNRNLDFVRGLDLYDSVTTYDTMLRDIDVHQPSVIVDMAGDGGVLGKLHAALGDRMVRTLNVGLTHWGERGGNAQIIKARSEFFFAPGHIARRMKELGPATFDQRTTAVLADIALKCRSWMRVTHQQGLDGLAAVYPDICVGRAAPQDGVIVVL
jgi:Protein of unknown function (DUF2855)